MLASIYSIIQETEYVRRIALEVPSVESYAFKPGQFVVITFANLPVGNNERSYSIASAPDGSNKIELCVVINPTGAGTPELWKMAVGDFLEISEPKGHFVLPEWINTDVAFICTGTGVAPFRSMLLHILYQKVPHNNLYLLFGNRSEKDILYHKEFKKLSEIFPEFIYTPILSRQADWKGIKGYVHSVYEDLFSDGRDARFYVCGWDAMCKEARHRLKALGYNRKQYFFEEYG